MLAPALTIVVGAALGAVLGAIGHAFTARWPTRRRPGVSRHALVGITAVAAVLLAVSGPGGAAGAAPAVLVALLAPIVAIDLDLRLIPDVLTVPGTAACIGVGAITGAPEAAAVWAVLAAGIFALPAAVAPGSVGWGDVKLAALMGAALGSAVLTALVAGLIVGAAMALGVVARHGCRARGRTLPFAPPLAAGCLVALVLG